MCGLEQVRDAGHLTYLIVNGPAGKDYLRVVPQFFGFINQVIRINRDAVAAHQTGSIAVEVPLGGGRI